MERLLSMGLKFVEDTYKVKKENVEVIDLVDAYLLNFEDEKRTFLSLKFLYDKDKKPSYSIEKELKVDDDVDVFRGENKPPTPPKKPSAKSSVFTPDDKGQDYSNIENHPYNREMESLLEEKQSEINQLMKIIDDQEIKSNGDNGVLKKENEKLKKEIIELKRQMTRDKEIYNNFTNYGKELRKKYGSGVTAEQIALIKKLVQEGKTETEIVKLSNTSNGTVWRVKKGLL